MTHDYEKQAQLLDKAASLPQIYSKFDDRFLFALCAGAAALRALLAQPPAPVTPEPAASEARPTTDGNTPPVKGFTMAEQSAHMFNDGRRVGQVDRREAEAGRSAQSVNTPTVASPPPEVEQAIIAAKNDLYLAGGFDTVGKVITIAPFVAALIAAVRAESSAKGYVDWGSGERLAMNALDYYLPDEGIAKSTSVVYRIHQLGSALAAQAQQIETLKAESYYGNCS